MSDVCDECHCEECMCIDDNLYGTQPTDSISRFERLSADLASLRKKMAEAYTRISALTKKELELESEISGLRGIIEQQDMVIRTQFGGRR